MVPDKGISATENGLLREAVVKLKQRMYTLYFTNLKASYQ